MDTLPPEELVTQCRNAPPGDFRPFERLVRVYESRVYSLAFRLLGNRQDAEDAAQEVFLKVHRGIRTLEEPATLTSWIYRITSNTCLDLLTTRQRRPQTQPLTPDTPAGDEEPRYVDARTLNPEQAALRRELYACLQAALTSLDPDGRAVLILRDVERRPYQEIAAGLKLGLSAVKMRIHRARLAFQQLLDQVCPGVARAARDAGDAASPAH
jgi:RNA polymerase sigma-70 factor (ECF subfamily)